MTLVAERAQVTPGLVGLTRQTTGEVVVFCPGCKALQTVQVSGNRLVPTRKFTQEGSHIFHDCGCSKPCRLYQHS
jgi:hypothetical protein